MKVDQVEAMLIVSSMTMVLRRSFEPSQVREV